MKVRLLNLVALTTIGLGTNALAQEDSTGLERALADLNNGLVAPLQGNVSANGSLGLNISGDARVRNTWINPGTGRSAATSPAYFWPTPPASMTSQRSISNGDGTDELNIDARIRLNFAFDVTEGASAFVQLNGHENWGTTGGANYATNEGAPGSPVSNFNTGVIEQAFFTANDLFGDGGEFKVGRSHYTLGSGRILGTDDWNQLPHSYSGLWYHHELDGWNLEAFVIQDAIFAGGVNGPFAGTGDITLWGATVDWAPEFLENDVIQDIALQPYFLRSSVRGPQGALAGTTGGFGVSKNWYGINVTANAVDGAIGIDAETVWVDHNSDSLVGAPSTGSFNAWALDLDINISEWLGEMPAGINPVIELGISQADEVGITIDPVYHNTAGLADVMGRSGAYSALAGGGLGASTGGGVWNGRADVWQIGVAVEPVDEWIGRVAFINFDDNFSAGSNPGLIGSGPNGTGSDATEIDLSVSHAFDNGVSMWVGWSRVDFNAFDTIAYVFYATFGLPF